MVSLGHVALDGTKVKANASKHKAMSHERMLRAEKQLAQEINALMRKAEILDAQEDRRNGKTSSGSDLPDELRRGLERLERIRQARKEMEAETAAAAARQQQEETDQARAQADAAKEHEWSAADQAELNRSVEAAEAKASAAREQAEESAKAAGLEQPDLQAGGRINAQARSGKVSKRDTHRQESAEFHRSRQPSHAIWWFVSAGLRLQAGCRQRASGDRGGGHEQPAAAGTAAQRCRCQNPHGPQAQKQEGIKDLRPAQGDRGAGERPDQGRPRSATIPAAGPGEGRR